MVTLHLWCRVRDVLFVADILRANLIGACRTLFATVQVVPIREAEERFHLTVWRSFAPHLRGLIDIAARELAAGL